MVAHCLCVVLAIYFSLYFWGVVAQESGPYEIILESVKNCEDKGTGEMSITSTARKDESGKIFHTGDLKMPYGLNDNFKAVADASVWKDNQWQPIGLIWKLNLPKACSSSKMLISVWFDILKAAKLTNVECNIAKGNYHFVDYHVGGSMKSVSSLPYGKYRARVSWSRRGKKIGCVAYLAQIVPAK